MQTLEPVIAGLALFQGMKPEHIALIAGCASNVRYEAGQFAGLAGDPADCFWIIRQGRMALEMHAPDRGTITIDTTGEGEIAGFSWLLPPYRLRFDVHALTATRALLIDGRCLRAKFEQDHELAAAMLGRFSTLMAERLESLSLQLMDVYGDHATNVD